MGVQEVIPIEECSPMRAGHFRMWVWRAYTMLAVLAVILIAVSAGLRESIHQPWAQILSAIVQAATIMCGGLASAAIHCAASCSRAMKNDLRLEHHVIGRPREAHLPLP
jgi:hypothetical protein